MRGAQWPMSGRQQAGRSGAGVAGRAGRVGRARAGRVGRAGAAAAATRVRGEKVQRRLDWTFPPAPMRREVREARPDDIAAGRPPLLCVHGAGMGAWAFERWLPAAAAAGWHAVAVSLRGHGGSEVPERLATTTLRHYEHDVLQTITELPAPPVLVGHCLGAVVVQRVLERYRSAPAAVLLSPPPPDHGLALLGALARNDPAALVRGGLGLEARPRPATLVGPATPAEEAAALAGRLDREPVLAALQVALPRRVPAVRTPVLVISGGEDRIVTPATAARTARLLGTRAHLYRGLGHNLLLERGWEDVLQDVLAWLGRTQADARRR